MSASRCKIFRTTIQVAAVGLLIMAVPALAGTDVKVNQDIEPLLQNETSITLNPSVPGNVVVGYNEAPGTGGGLGISYSFNYGATWNDTQTQSVWGYSDGDPSVAADLLGNIYAAQLSYGVGPLVFPNNGIYCSISTNGGMTWSVPVVINQCTVGTVPQFFTDKPYIKVDTYTGSPYTNRFYVAWQRDRDNGVNADILFAWSGNQLATINWAAGGLTPGQISDLPSAPGSPPVQSSNGNAPCPAVAPNGDVYVAWQDAPLCIQGPGRIYVDKSTDGGQTFGVDVLAVSYNTCARWPKGGISFQVRSFPSIAVSPVLNPYSNYDVYIVYAEDPDRGTDIKIESDPGSNQSLQPEIACYSNNVYSVWIDTRSGAAYGDVYFNRSTDYGNTWGTDQRINTYMTPGAVSVNTPRIAADSADVHVVWEDRRNGGADLYYNYSTDFGATWQSSDIRIDTGNTPGTTNAWAPQIGAYRGNVFIIWTDDRTGDADVLCNYSTNGGATWQSSPVRVDNAASGVWSSSPRLSWYRNNVYVTWYDARNGFNDIFHNVSFDGGQTWQASDAQLDNPWTGVSGDPCIAGDSNYVYVAWWDQRSGQQDIYLNYSTDNGLTWQPSDTRLDTGDAPGASSSGQVDLACVGRRVFAVWEDNRNGLSDVYYNSSSDNGATWQGDQRIDSDYVAGNNNSTSPRISVQQGYVYIVYEDNRHGYSDIYFRYSLTYGASWYPRDIRLDTGDYAGASISASPRITSDGANVYAVWLDQRNGTTDVYFNSSVNNGISWRDGPDDGDIMLIRSDDGGATWNPPVRVNNDVTPRGQFQPWIDVKPNGVVDVVWYDRRNDGNDSWLDVYMGTSRNRGQNFVNSRVSDVNFGPPPAPTVWPWPWIGEYMGIDVDSTYAYIAWTDTRLNDLDIFFDRFENPTATGVLPRSAVPRMDYLAQNYPNPFNPSTTIAFGLTKAGYVSLRIYDVSGKLVRIISEGQRLARDYEEVWDGKDDDGVAVASGVYFCRLTSNGFTQTRKLVLLK